MGNQNKSSYFAQNRCVAQCKKPSTLPDQQKNVDNSEMKKFLECHSTGDLECDLIEHERIKIKRFSAKRISAASNSFVNNFNKEQSLYKAKHNSTNLITNMSTFSPMRPSDEDQTQSFGLEKDQIAYLDFDVRKAYEFQARLGEGSFGIVHKVTEKKNLMVVRAIKNVQDKYEQQFFSEFQALQQLDHPNIVKMRELYQEKDKGSYHLVMDYCEGGDLGSYLQNPHNKPLDESQARAIMFQVLQGATYFQQKGYLHRDIKAENVLLSSKKKTEDKSKTVRELVGSHYYLAPEVLRRKYDSKCDIWSLGVLLYYMLSKTLPYRAKDREALLMEIENCTLQLEGPAFDKISDNAKDLIRKLLNPNPQLRITLQSALSHFWFLSEWNEVDLEVSRLKDSFAQTILDNLKQSRFIHLSKIASTQFLQGSENVSESTTLFYSLQRGDSGVIQMNDLLRFLSKRLRRKHQDIKFELLRATFDQKPLPQTLKYSEFLAYTLDFKNLEIKQKDLKWMNFRCMQDPVKDTITVNSLTRQMIISLSLSKEESFQARLEAKELIEQITGWEDAQEVKFSQYNEYLSSFTELQ